MLNWSFETTILKYTLYIGLGHKMKLGNLAERIIGLLPNAKTQCKDEIKWFSKKKKKGKNILDSSP